MVKYMSFESMINKYTISYISKLNKYGFFLPILSEIYGVIPDDIANPKKYADPNNPISSLSVHVRLSFWESTQL